MVNVPPRFGVCAPARYGAAAAPASAMLLSARRSRRERVMDPSLAGSAGCAAELQDSIADALRRLLRRHHGPVVRLWKHLAEAVRARHGVGRIIAGKDERGQLHGRSLAWCGRL